MRRQTKKPLEYTLLYAAGFTLAEIGMRYGVTRQCVEQSIRRCKLRPTGFMMRRKGFAKKGHKGFVKQTHAEVEQKDFRLLFVAAEVLTDWSLERIKRALDAPKVPAYLKRRRFDCTLGINREQEVYQLKTSGLSNPSVRFLTGLSDGSISSLMNRATRRRAYFDAQA